MFKSAKNIAKTLKMAAAGALLIAGISQAAVINTTLDTLLLGGSNQNGIVIGDKKYSEFTYNPTGPSVPAAKNVGVTISTTDGAHYQLRFAMGLNAAPGETNDMLIGYRLDVVNSSDVITKVGLDFNGAVPVAGSGFAAASVTEMVHSVDGSDVAPGAPIRDSEQLNVFNDGAAGLPDNNSSSLVVNPTKALLFTKDILVTSRETGGFVSISYVDNTVDQSSVPEPTAITGLAVGGLVTLGRRRRSR